jgi:light-regulated signal transduction histidine kinase (bacteriophytochrome)
MQSQELKSSNEELEKFAYVASHDLQEPLRMIDSFLTLLESKYSSQLDDKAKQYIYYSVDGAKRMRQIILDLLEFSRAGSFSGELEEINLEEVMEEIKHLQSKVIEEKSATITYEALPILIAMNSPVLQIFHNLIGNALKYSQKTVPPKIHICSERKGDFWNFCVKDNGIGISKEYQERIFVIFQRLHGKTEYSGTGLGLSIVKKIIEKMEGNIWVESEGVGKGSSFYFQIPLKWVKIDD